MKRLVLVAVMAVVATACLGSDFADSVEGSWQLTEGTVNGEVIPIIDSHPITLTFDGEQVGGTASCNSYGGTFQLDGSTISFSNLAMTEMACMPEETMIAEQLYASGLTMVEALSLDQTLVLSGPDVELTFDRLEPVPDAELTNTIWVLDGLIVGETVTSPVADSRATVEFFTDGSMLGDTGCRPFSGKYEINGAEVVLTELAADGHECEPGVADQDSRVISALEGSFRVEIENDRLTTWTHGDEGLTFLAEK
ncbi:MAG TPA: META domain-containing protein [Acidimicrobiia bacterium]|nr:META domain-containing protein [Acidimicrobiia bacterium]